MTQAMQTPTLLCGVSEVARLLAVSKREVTVLVAEGRMPRPTKLGRLSRWTRASLEAWAAAGCPWQNGNGEANSEAPGDASPTNQGRNANRPTDRESVGGSERAGT